MLLLGSVNLVWVMITLDVYHIRYFPFVLRDGCRCGNRLGRGVPCSVEVLTGFVDPLNYSLVSVVRIDRKWS
jgi:hypothetical protein